MAFQRKQVLKLGNLIREEALSVHAKYNYWADDLESSCAVCSELFFIGANVHIKNVKTHFINGHYDKGYDHCWNQVGRYIVDLTATQFGIKEEIYILAPKNDKRDLYNKKLLNDKALDDIEKHWPREQKLISLEKEFKQLLRKLRNPNYNLGIEI